jgi:hypothetical protein
MGFLDSIGQRAPESGAQDSRSAVGQNRTRDDAARAVPSAPTWTPPKNDGLHPAAIWFAVLFVVGAVAAAGWLATRNAQSVVSPPAEGAADAQPQQDQKKTAVDKLTAKPRLVRPQAAARRGTGVVSSGEEPRADAPSEASASDPAPVNHAANVTETEEQPIEATSDPIAATAIVALLEDDNVYSSEGAGVVAPQLTSLGFVRRLVSGLRVRTSTIELVVSKTGTVERAKIFSRPAHWEDALLLSRAKTFQFVPAYRNGFPVRYRFVIDVDTSP